MTKGFARDSGIDNTRFEYEMARIERKKLKKIEQAKFFFRKRYVYGTLSVNCQLYRGEDKFPRTKMMSLAELGAENKKLILNNIKRMDKGDEDAPLYRWLVIDREELDGILSRNMDKNITLNYEKNELI